MKWLYHSSLLPFLRKRRHSTDLRQRFTAYLENRLRSPLLVPEADRDLGVFPPPPPPPAFPHFGQTSRSEKEEEKKSPVDGFGQAETRPRGCRSANIDVALVKTFPHQPPIPRPRRHLSVCYIARQKSMKSASASSRAASVQGVYWPGGCVHGRLTPIYPQKERRHLPRKFLSRKANS